MSAATICLLLQGLLLNYDLSPLHDNLSTKTHKESFTCPLVRYYMFFNGLCLLVHILKSPLAHFGALLCGCVPDLCHKGDRNTLKPLVKVRLQCSLHWIIISNGAFQRTQTSTWLPSHVFGRVVWPCWPCVDVKDMFPCYHTVSRTDKYGRFNT